MKSIMAGSVLGVSILATPVAHADPYRNAGPTWYIDIAPGSSSGYCTALDDGIRLSPDGTQIIVSADVIRLTKRNKSCPDVEVNIPWAYPTQTVQYAISYVLYKWDGSKQVLCGTNPGWPGWEQPAPTKNYVRLTTPNGYSGSTNDVSVTGCGSGYYVAYIQGYYLDANGWQGGTVFTDWAYFNLPDSPIIK